MPSIEFGFTEVDTEAEGDRGLQGCDACMHCHLLRTMMLNRIAETPKHDRSTPARSAERGIDRGHLGVIRATHMKPS